MAKITLNGVDALTESGGTVTVAAGTNLVLGTDAVPSAAIQDNAVTSAKFRYKYCRWWNSWGYGATTLSSTLAVTGNGTFNGAVQFNSDIKAGTIKANDGTASVSIADSTGNVGLGITNPTAAKLEVAGSLHVGLALASSPEIKMQSSGTGFRQFFIKVDDSNSVLRLDSTFSTGSAYPISFQMGGVEKMKITTGGDLETSTTGKVKQKGAFMQSSTHQAMVMGG